MAIQPGLARTLHIRVMNARGLYNTETFGKMDPYVIVTLSKHKKQKSPTKNDAGRDPVWNWEVSFPYEGEQQLEFQVYDKDTFTSDDFVGSAAINVQAVMSGYQGELQLYRSGGKKAGTLNVAIQWPVQGQMAAMQVQGQMPIGQVQAVQPVMGVMVDNQPYAGGQGGGGYPYQPGYAPGMQPGMQFPADMPQHQKAAMAGQALMYGAMGGGKKDKKHKDHKKDKKDKKEYKEKKDKKHKDMKMPKMHKHAKHGAMGAAVGAGAVAVGGLAALGGILGGSWSSVGSFGSFGSWSS